VSLRNIKWFQVAIVALVLTVLSVGAIYIFLIKPVEERYGLAQTKLETQEAALTKAQGEKKPAELDLAKAKVEVATAKREWAVYDRQLNPRIELTNRFIATRQLWNEQLNVLGPKVVKFLYNDRSVRVLSEDIKVPEPSGDPNAAVQKVYVYPFGNVTVSGTFDQVMKHAARWNRFDRLALVDGLVLSGNSPTLTGTYTLTVYEISNFDTVGPVIPQATETPGGIGGGRGGLGGPPPGFVPPGGGGPGGPGGLAPVGQSGPTAAGGAAQGLDR